MVSAEDVFRASAAMMAKWTLSTLPVHLEAATKARELLKIATGEDFDHKSTRCAPAEDTFDMQSKLFSLVHHILGAARRFELGQLGEEYSKVPAIGQATKALQEALHRDLLRTQINQAACVDDLIKSLEISALANNTDNDAKVEAVVMKLVQQIPAKKYKRPKAAPKPRRPAETRGGDEKGDGDDATADDDSPETIALIADLRRSSLWDLQQRCKVEHLPRRDGTKWFNKDELVEQLAKKKAAVTLASNPSSVFSGHKRKKGPESPDRETSDSKRTKLGSQ